MSSNPPTPIRGASATTPGKRSFDESSAQGNEITPSPSSARPNKRGHHHDDDDDENPDISIDRHLQPQNLYAASFDDDDIPPQQQVHLPSYDQETVSQFGYSQATGDPLLEPQLYRAAADSLLYLLRGDGSLISLAGAATTTTTTHHQRAAALIIGRDPRTCDIVCHNAAVSRHHATLYMLSSSNASCCCVRLQVVGPSKKVWVRPTAVAATSWIEYNGQGSAVVDLPIGAYFSLAPPVQGKCPDDLQFGVFRHQPTCGTRVRLGRKGSQAFDEQYLHLLQLIANKGLDRVNNKGPNWTYTEGFTFEIDLSSSSSSSSDTTDECLLPITTLRYLYQGRPCVLEAVWYLRGENNVKFLQTNGCTFWDKQAKPDGQVGLNYGLLTNWPLSSSASLLHGERQSANQLLENVILPLTNNKCSRNMVCSLCNPGQDTVQGACTVSVQFSVGASDHLDLTVNQRSSDVILGLPHDVVVWSVILHLVCKEVQRRKEGSRLRAGRLFFCIAAGGGHVYKQNEDAMDSLLARKPIEGTKARMQTSFGKKGSSLDLFEFAQNYGKDGNNILVQGYSRHPETNACAYHPRLVIEQALDG